MWPRFFEEFYWLREEVDLLDEAVISRAVRWRASVADAGRDGRRARLAVDRLRSVALRESVLDSVLDATIALEGLLSDGARTELTHKGL
jgi:hypothetical protein